MSDVFTKQRPMINLDKFEKHLYPPRCIDQRDLDPLTELLCIIGGKDGSHETDFEPKTQLLAKAQPDTGEPGEWKQADKQVRRVGDDFAAIEAGLLGMKQPQTAIVRGAEKSSVEYKRQTAQAPLISGDIAAIEAGLLGALREQATATVSEANISNALPTVDLGAERWPHQEHQPVTRHVGDADGQKRRPLYAMVAIGIAAMAGIAVSFGLYGRLSGPPEIEPIKADNGPPTRQEDAARSADIPARDVAIPSKPPEPSPMALDNGTERPLDSPQADEKSLPAGSQARIDNESPAAVPPAPAQAPTPAEPLSNPAAPVKSDAIKTDMVRPNGTLLPNGRPRQANINGASLPAPQPRAAAKAPAAKVAGHVAKSLKSATAKHLGSHSQPRQVANKTTATPVAPLNTEPAPITNSKVEPPPTQPSPATNGAIGFVQSAVNSLTGTTAKLLEWGRN